MRASRFGTTIISFILLIYSYCNFGHIIPAQLHFAEEMYRGHFLVLHPGIYWMADGFSWLTSLSIKESLHLLLSVHVALTFAAIVWVMRRLGSEYIISNPALWLCALAVMIAAPLGLPDVPLSTYNFTASNRSFFLLRNATYTGLLSYAITSFGLLMLLCRQKNYGTSFPWKQAFTASALLFISALIKPSFALTIIPAIGLYLLCDRRPWSNRFFLMALMLPAGVLMLFQFYIGFVHSSLPPYPSNFTLDPFVVWQRNNVHILLSMLLAMLFPLIVLYGCRNSLSAETRIAWVSLALSLIPYLLLRQTSGVFNDRDFEWSYLNARQILFLCSIVEWWRWHKRTFELHPHYFPQRVMLADIAGMILLAHAVFGYARLLLIDQWR